VAAQVLEINLNRGAVAVSDTTLTKLYELKSGPFVLAAWLASALANIELRNQERLSRFAMYLGMAYQLTDDVSDAEGKAAEMGKLVGMDRGKINWVTHFGVGQSKALVQELLFKAEKILDKLPYNMLILRDLMWRVVARAGSGFDESNEDNRKVFARSASR
jgi:geranylgeranyl diphosphate synthase type II